MDRVFGWVRKSSYAEARRMNSHDTGSSDGASQAMLPLARVASDEAAPAYMEHDPTDTPQDRMQSSGNRQTDGSVRDPDAHSMATLLADGQPEPDKHKKNYFMTMSLCHMYGMFIMTLGILISVTDPFLRAYSVTPIFFLILCAMGIAYLSYLVIDIWIEEIKDKRAEQSADQQISRLESRHYTFDLSKHGSNFYLKLGAAAFALGHLVHFALMFMVLDSFNALPECKDTPQFVLEIIYMFYSFMQLVFVFKYNNIIILKRRVLARFGFMHFIASNISFWVWSIVRETMLALYAYQYSKNVKESSTNETVSTANYTEFVPKKNSSDCFSLSPTMQVVFKNFSPYLFPFTVEFSIIMGGLFLIIWLNIGKNILHAEKPLDLAHRIRTLGSTNSIDALEEPPSKFTIYADCHSSSRGIMAGFFVLVVTMSNLMVCFILANVNSDQGSAGAVYIIDYTKLGLHVMMLATVIAAYYQTRDLDVNPHPVSSVDDIMLLLCIPGFFLDSTLTMVATIYVLNVVKFIDSAVNAIQVVLQTSFLMDRMRRCCNSRELRRSKPGRQLVMFLIITNVAMWLFNTFSYKSPESKDERYAFYGKEWWTVLGHVSLPLIMFYRFHSSVCLADIWQLGYQKSDH